MSITLSNTYTTSDLALACAISLYFPIEAIDRTNPRKSQFLFKRNVGLDEIVEAYWKNELQVNPAAYFSQIRAVKARLYGEHG